MEVQLEIKAWKGKAQLSQAYTAVHSPKTHTDHMYPKYSTVQMTREYSNMQEIAKWIP